MRTALHIDHDRDADGRTRYTVQLVGGRVFVATGGGTLRASGSRNDDTRAPARPRVSWPALAGGLPRN